MSIGASISPAFTSNAVRGDDLTPGLYYQLELCGGEGTCFAVPGLHYLATDQFEDGQRLMVNTNNGDTFYTDVTDIYSR